MSERLCCPDTRLPGFLLVELGLTRYDEVMELQLGLHADVKAGKITGALILVEHLPVITMGASAEPKNVLVPADVLESNCIDLVKTDRGGDATYHGPGQLVGYPIVNLRTMGSDVHNFLRLLESTVISTIADFGVTGGRNGPAGVWVGDKKICSIGIAVRGGVTYHGFALNVDPDLRHFAFINPCGLDSERITSLKHLADPLPDMDTVRARVVEHFQRHFGLLIERK